jgi:hypothetical protein
MTRKNDWKTLIADSLILLDEFDETLFAKGTTKGTTWRNFLHSA